MLKPMLFSISLKLFSSFPLATNVTATPLVPGIKKKEFAQHSPIIE
jgi:hypothetical protein